MDKVKILVNLGVEEKRNGRYESALSYYNKALKIDKSNPEVFNAMGKVNFILGNYNDAFTYFLLAADSSARYIDVNLLLNETESIQEKIRKSAVIGQSQSLIFNLGKHCGFAIVARDFNGETMATIPDNERPLIEASLKAYRKQIDPIYNSGYISFGKEDLQLVENYALQRGINVFYEFGKLHNKNLKYIADYFLK